MSRSDNTERIIVPIAAPAQPWPHLVVLAGPEIGKVFRLAHAGTTIGRSLDADVQFSSPSVSRLHAVVRILGSRVTIEDLNSKNGVFVGIKKTVGLHEIRDGDEVTIGDTVLVKLTYTVALEGALRHAGYEVASHDPVTHAANVAHFLDRLRTEHAFVRRHNQPLVLAVIRPDGLEGDTLPDETDDVMRVVAAVVRSTIRTEDLLARITGNELVILLRGDTAQAHAMAERARLRARNECEGAARMFAPATITVAIVPLAPWMTLAPETILVAARNEARRSMTGKTDTVVLLPLLELV